MVNTDFDTGSNASTFPEKEDKDPFGKINDDSFKSTNSIDSSLNESRKPSAEDLMWRRQREDRR